MPFIIPKDRNQIMFLGCYEDMISADNPVRIIDLLVERLIAVNPEDFKRTLESDFGRPSYLTATMLKLFVYGYFNSISSSRKLEQEANRNIELIWLLGDLHPKYWIIADYRKLHGDHILKLTKQFRKFLRSNEYIDFKREVCDGTKVKANAKRGMLQFDHIEKKIENINAEISGYFKQLEIEDNRSDVHEEGYPEKDILGEMEIIEKIQNLESELEKYQNLKDEMEKTGEKRISTTDPEAKLMKSSDGKFPCYNAQTSVDAKNHFISSCETTTDTNDTQQIEKIADTLIEEYGETPKEMFADKGYYNTSQIENVEDKGIDVYVMVPNQKSTLIKKGFTYNEEKDIYLCPAGKVLVLKRSNTDKKGRIHKHYECSECTGCPLYDKCVKSKGNRKIHSLKTSKYIKDYKKKLSSPMGKLVGQLRKSIVEHPYGTIKCLMGKIPIKLRGRQKVATEMNLYTTVYNLKRLINIEPIDTIVEKFIQFGWK